MGNNILPESAVLAFGGNALKGNGNKPESRTIIAQERAMAKAAKVITEVRKFVEKILVVHGNGPQAGWMLKRTEIAAKAPHNMHEVPLSNIVASSQGPIGLGMAKKIVNVDPRLREKVIEIGTQVQVDKNDPAFQNPSKPVGSFMTKEEATRKRDEDNWVIAECSDGPTGKPFRRVVPSPEPIAIEEISAIKLLIDNKIITICVGGGGVPFILKEDGSIEWVDAVIDKDKAAALAAIILEIKLLAIFTAQEGIYDPKDFNRKHNGDNSVKPIPTISTKDLQQIIPELPSGSMKPKAQALHKFAEETQNKAWIGPLDGGYEALTEGRGTNIIPS